MILVTPKPEDAMKDVGGHRDTTGLSDVGKQIIEGCPNAYVLNGQVFDPCCVWWGVKP